MMPAADALSLTERWIRTRLPKLRLGGTPDRLPVTLHRRRIYILPTRYGLFFALVLFVMLLGALNYDNNLALLLTFLLGGMFLIAPVHTYRNLAGLKINGIHFDPVFAGEHIVLRLHLSSLGHRDRPAIRAHCDACASTVSVPIESGATVTLEWPANRRGRHVIEGIRLDTTFPLGLFRAWSWLDRPGGVLVYPRPERPAVPFPQHGGGAGARTSHDSDEFSGLRPYRSGDPSRLIAWKALAHTDQLLTKEFHGADAASLWLDFNNVTGLNLEARLSRLTRWILEARRQNIRFGLNLPGQVFEPDNTEMHFHNCLRALALFQAP